MKLHAFDQRTPEWYAVRLGKLTGSSAGDMLATIKSGEAASRRDLRMRLVCERLTGQSAESGYVNSDMQRGIDLEPAARAAYEAITGSVVSEVGFIEHDARAAGCSPDGLIDGGRVLLSIKCPKSSTHLGYLRSGQFPSTYRGQMLHELWITGAEEYHFFSFDDRFPPPLDTCLVRVTREGAEIAAYEQKALAFLGEVDREEEAVRSMFDLRKHLESTAV